MAFGKTEDRSHLAGTFTQQSSYSNKRPPRQEGGGKPYWIDNYQPTENVDMVRLIPGSYSNEQVDAATGNVVNSVLPWYLIVEHYHGSLKKGALCSAGPLRRTKGKRNPCVGCDIYWQDYAERERIKSETGQKVQNPNRISMSEKKVMTVLDYSPYYEAEQIDSRTGRVRTNSSGQPFMEWRKLYYANDPAAAGRNIKNGRALPWQLNFGQFEALRIYTKFNIGECCVGCSGYGTSMNKILQTLQYVCKSCRNPAIDARTTTLSPQQIEELFDNPFTCQACGHFNFLEEVVHCEQCAAKGTTPARASLWDVDIQVRMQKDPQSPTKNILSILNHSQPRPIDPRFLELAKPLDLPSMFMPTPVEKQKTIWGISDMPALTPGQPMTVPYGQPGIAAPPPPPQMGTPFGWQQPPKIVP